MLLSVCLNPAIDVTYRLDVLVVPGHSHRVGSVHERAGGKGINVARVAQRLGLATMLLAPVGGATGALVRAELTSASSTSASTVPTSPTPVSGTSASPIPTSPTSAPSTSASTISMFPTTPPIEGILVEIAGTTRRTIAVVDPHDATLFNEPGPFVSLDEWHSLVNAFETALDRATLVVLSGSLPPGAPIDAYAQLTELATRRSVPVIVDAEGEPLHRALSARPYLIKPNLAELRTIVDGPLDTLAEITSAGKELRRRGARNVVVSCGRDGLIAITEDGQWQAKGPSVEGNPTGAGDALVAALSAGTVRDDPWEQRLRDGVAWSAAAVAAPLAGQVDPATATALALGVRLEQLPEPRTTPSEVLIENPVDLEPGRESAH